MKRPDSWMFFDPLMVQPGSADRGYLERETGVEPATSSLARKHSTTELLPLSQAQVYRPNFCMVNASLQSYFLLRTGRNLHLIWELFYFAERRWE